tara:strand:+ start:403 stop:747 length:345 start_codon:yes stop_codon:yes gene_type:complete
MPRKTKAGKNIVQFKIVDEEGKNDLRGFMVLWKNTYDGDGTIDDLVNKVRRQYSKRNDKTAKFTADKCEAKMRKLIQRAEKLNADGENVSVPKALRGMGGETESTVDVLADFSW